MVSPVVNNVNSNSYQKFQLKAKYESPNYSEYTYEKPAPFGKKCGVALASGLVPGLGQAINGQWGKAALFFIPNVVVNYLRVLTSFGSSLKPLKYVSMGLRGLAAIDAVKNAKSEVKQIVPKEQGKVDVKA